MPLWWHDEKGNFGKYFSAIIKLSLHILFCSLPEFHRSHLWVSRDILLCTNRFRNRPLCFSHNVWVNICRRNTPQQPHSVVGPKEMSQPLPRLLWHGTTTHHSNATIAIENSKDSVNWVAALIHYPPQQSNSVAGKINKKSHDVAPQPAIATPPLQHNIACSKGSALFLCHKDQLQRTSFLLMRAIVSCCYGQKPKKKLEL